MELGVRDWIIIVGALVVFAIALEVFRSIRSHQRDNLRMSFRSKKPDAEEGGDDLQNPELPAGGARVVAVRRSVQPSDGGRLQIDKDVPVLMDPLAEDDSLYHGGAAESADPTDEIVESVPAAEPEPAAAADRVETPEPQSEPKKSAPSAREDAGSSAKPDFQELIVLNVKAREPGNIKGSELVQILLACDMRFGKMQIFHRYENSDGSGAEQFGVANLVEPGTFDLDNIEGFETPGVVFFLHLPGPEKPLDAFECMVETARCLVNNLGCELLDEAHSVATTQTIEHYRQRIRDFERKQLTLV